MKSSVSINSLVSAVLVLGFGVLSGPNLASLAASVIAAMSDNPFFPTPTVPAIADLQVLLNNYNTAAAAAASRDKNAVMAKRLARLSLIEGMQALARWCMSQANGDKQMLESTGFPLNKRGSQQTQPEIPTPTNMQVTDGPVPYSIYVSIDGNKLYKSVTFQYTTTDPSLPGSVWTSEFVTTSEYIFFNLQPNTRHWFRVVVVGTRKQVKVSDIKTRLVQ
jgi:hypothetical protein